VKAWKESGPIGPGADRPIAAARRASSCAIRVSFPCHVKLLLSRGCEEYKPTPHASGGKRDLSIAISIANCCRCIATGWPIGAAGAGGA